MAKWHFGDRIVVSSALRAEVQQEASRLSNEAETAAVAGKPLSATSIPGAARVRQPQERLRRR
jgi:hypothetical protein